MKTSNFNEKFDEGESVIEWLDLEQASRPELEVKRVNVDFPAWMAQALDKEARRVGVTHQALIKLWLADKLSK
ncbi:MAG: type II toxin-antitoxin system BrnA family antitoxin [Candidatus Nitrosoglobus sp.]|jgi:hypothetical protein